MPGLRAVNIPRLAAASMLLLLILVNAKLRWAYGDRFMAAFLDSGVMVLSSAASGMNFFGIMLLNLVLTFLSPKYDC